MLHWFVIFSVPGTITHGFIRLLPRSLASSRGCSLAIKLHLNWIELLWQLQSIKSTYMYMYMLQVLGHFCISGAFSSSLRSDPSPHSTNNVGHMYLEFFLVSTLYRVGGGRTTRKFRKECTVLWGNREMTEKYEYCITVPRTFVHDCRLFLNFLCFFKNQPRLKKI